MIKIIAIYGSPRRKGNTSSLLKQAVKGARDAGAEVEELFLRDLNISPCMEYYGCKKDGKCVIRDDFDKFYKFLSLSEGVIIASPIFFYSVSAQTKALMDRCQSLWIKKYWIDKTDYKKQKRKRKGMFICAGATGGKKLFEGVLLTVKYFFDAVDADLWKNLLYRGLDGAKDIMEHPEYLEEAYIAGKEMVNAIRSEPENNNP